jgi:hypothetical protein
VTAHVESGALRQNRFAASFTSRFSNLLELVRRNLPGDQAAVLLSKDQVSWHGEKPLQSQYGRCAQRQLLAAI